MLDLTTPSTSTSTTPLIAPLLDALLPTNLLESVTISSKTLQRQKQKEEKLQKKELARLERELNPSPVVAEKKLGFLPREWSFVPTDAVASTDAGGEEEGGGGGGSTKVSIMSWNVSLLLFRNVIETVLTHKLINRC